MDCLKTYYGIEAVTLTYLSLGADMDASVYKADTQKGRSYFVKLKRGHHHDISTAIMELLQYAKIQQIIPPIKTIQGLLTQHSDNFTFIVYPFVEGQDGFSHSLTDEQWFILGKTLRQIHEIDVPSPIQHRIRREIYSSKWREAVRSFYPHLEAEVTGDPMAVKLLIFMKDNRKIIERLVARAEQLAQKIHNESPKFVLCHADIHGGNILIDKNNNPYIVDWDDPIMAPKERDLMFIGGGVGNVWNKPLEEALFYKGYGDTAINRTLLAYYRHERIVEDIALYCQSLLFTTEKHEDKLEIYEHFISMFVSRGVVDIAFETDEISRSMTEY
ncbi:MAG: aminoglycoside phosphotransferase family protein [Proteobacteria bacterium]|nr:aminoglycoside phosphotransferase family protein [Pseudomonadota bacterium]